MMMQRMNAACSTRCFTPSTVAPLMRRTFLAPAKISVVPVVVVVAGHAKARSLKTRKSCAKRFKVTGSGKLVARHAGKQHFNEKKSAKLINNLDRKFVLAASDVPRAVKCLPHHGVGK